MAKKLTSKKAREILHDKEVHGHPLTDKQRKFFGAIAGGAKPYENGGWLDKYSPKAQYGDLIIPQVNPAESTGRIIKTKTGPVSASGPNKELQAVAKSNLKGAKASREVQEKEKKQRIAERKSATEAIDNNKPFTFPTGETKSWDKMDWREKAYVSGKALEQRGRLNENDESFIDEWINPLSIIGDVASGLGTAPYEARTYDSNLPYLGAVATPLIMGATGFDPLGSALKVPGKVAQSTESGLLSNTYKINPWAFKPNKANWYRQVGDAGYQDALQTGMIRGVNEDLNRTILNKIDEPYFSKGEPFFSAYEIKPTGTQSDKYLIEGSFPTENIIPAAGNNRWIDHMEELSKKGLTENTEFGVLQKDPELRNLENFNIYKKDWLRGYKEIKPPKKKAQNGIEGTMGGLTDIGFNYNGAWGGQFAMGGSLPGSVGFTYARTGSTPSEGPYAKKTMPSADNGMSFYQHGLDWTPRNISENGSVIKDNMGYWNPENWGKVVEIDSPDITMRGVNQPLIGISDEGDIQYMEPEKDYKFKGKKVKEYPIAKNGSQQDKNQLVKLDQLTNFTNYNKPEKGGWLDKYTK